MTYKQVSDEMQRNHRTATAPCDDCGRPVKVPQTWPVDYAYCGCDTPAWPK